jgi:8-oxo-dGTP pyrophosphatase MutT (NUDIX family)
MILRVVSGLAIRDGKILMGKRPATKLRGGLWETPGGKVEPGESPIKALEREWLEEVDLKVEVGSMIASCSFDLEIPFVVELYVLSSRNSFDGAKPIDHSDLEWVEPRTAVKFWACSPAIYSHYPQIRAYFRNHLNDGRSV